MSTITLKEIEQLSDRADEIHQNGGLDFLRSLLKKELPTMQGRPKIQYIYGMRVISRRSVPKGEIHFANSTGKVIKKVKV